MGDRKDDASYKCRTPGVRTSLNFKTSNARRNISIVSWHIHNLFHFAIPMCYGCIPKYREEFLALYRHNTNLTISLNTTGRFYYIGSINVTIA